MIRHICLWSMFLICVSDMSLAQGPPRQRQPVIKSLLACRTTRDPSGCSSRLLKIVLDKAKHRLTKQIHKKGKGSGFDPITGVTLPPVTVGRFTVSATDVTIRGLKGLTLKSSALGSESLVVTLLLPELVVEGDFVLSGLFKASPHVILTVRGLEITATVRFKGDVVPKLTINDLKVKIGVDAVNVKMKNAGLLGGLVEDFINGNQEMIKERLLPEASSRIEKILLKLLNDYIARVSR